jgi:cell division protein FtsW
VKKIKLQKQKLSADKNLAILILTFVFLGLLAVADVSAPQALNQYGNKFFFLRQQVMWAGLGLGILFVVSKIHYSFWRKIATPFFFATVLFLILVLIPQLSLSALGARRWISIGNFNFQPSELVKLGLAVYLAKVSEKAKKPLSYFLPLVLVTGLVMLQPDLGTTMIIALIGFSQIFISEVHLLYLFGALAVGAISTVGLILTSTYRKDRLLTFLEMTRDPLGKSYHIRQVLLSLGSGGVFGVGLGASRQKYSFLPEASTDSIFAVIAEELGLIGALVIISLFVYFILKGLAVARKAPDTFSKVLAVGITVWIGGQAFLNIASMVALVPLTGIPLPFLSYGGSSLIMVLVGCGILLNISKYGVVEKKKS